MEFDDIGNGGYTNWVLDKYLKSDEGSRSRFVEDLYKVANSLKAFDVKKNKGFWKDPKDINQYKTIKDIQTAVDKYEGIKAKNEFKVSSKDVIYDDGTWSIKVPKTREASCVLGRGTKWCTASQGNNNMFDHYSKEGRLYVISNGIDKWQFHPESKQFMDKNDNEIPNAGFIIFPYNVLKTILNTGWYTFPRTVLNTYKDIVDGVREHHKNEFLSK